MITMEKFPKETQCDGCIHGDVCMYKDKLNDINKTLLDSLDDIALSFIELSVKCKFHKVSKPEPRHRELDVYAETYPQTSVKALASGTGDAFNNLMDTVKSFGKIESNTIEIPNETKPQESLKITQESHVRRK